MNCEKLPCLFNVDGECALTGTSPDDCGKYTYVKLDDKDIEEIMQAETDSRKKFL